MSNDMTMQISNGLHEVMRIFSNITEWQPTGIIPIHSLHNRSARAVFHDQVCHRSIDERPKELDNIWMI
jgi:hypothetical protein